MITKLALFNITCGQVVIHCFHSICSSVGNSVIQMLKLFECFIVAATCHIQLIVIMRITLQS